MTAESKESLWMVVYVFRGMPARIKLFPQAQLAYRYEKNLRKRMNRDYDETGVFVIDRRQVASALQGKAISLRALEL